LLQELISEIVKFKNLGIQNYLHILFVLKLTIFQAV